MIMKTKSPLLLLLVLSIANCNSQDQSQDFQYEILDHWLQLNLDEQQVISKLGEPDKKGAINYWEAIGLNVQQWEYVEEGVHLEMYAEEPDHAKSILTITVTQPNQFKTSKGVSLGSAKSKVLAAYQEALDLEMSNEDQIVVGSIYGGVIFDFKNHEVSKIFIGAAAE